MDIPGLIEALSKFAWPMLAAIVLWKLFPGIRGIMNARAFAVKLGGMEVTVQEASDQLKTQIEDLQQQVLALRSHAPPIPEAPEKAPQPRPSSYKAPNRVLWLDDRPSNNAFEIGTLKDKGVVIDQARSTAEAIRFLSEDKDAYAAVVTDLGRKEDGRYQSEAGLQFIKEARALGFESPIIVYSSIQHAMKKKDDVLRAGGSGITASPVELLIMLKSAGIGWPGTAAQRRTSN